MKRFFLVCCLIMFMTPVFAVEQEYMPDGYVRDDVIYPYYRERIREYFRKVDDKEIGCNWGTYRREVGTPVGRFMDKKFQESKRGFNFSN